MPFDRSRLGSWQCVQSSTLRALQRGLALCGHDLFLQLDTGPGRVQSLALCCMIVTAIEISLGVGLLAEARLLTNVRPNVSAANSGVLTRRELDLSHSHKFSVMIFGCKCSLALRMAGTYNAPRSVDRETVIQM